MSIDHLLIHTVTVQRNTPTNQGGGRFKDGYADLHVDIPFRISGLSATERRIAQQDQTLATHAGYALPGLDIRRDDHVVDVLREDGSIDPASYRVTGVVSPSILHHTKVLLEQIQRG